MVFSFSLLFLGRDSLWHLGCSDTGDPPDTAFEYRDSGHVSDDRAPLRPVVDTCLASEQAHFSM